MVNSPDYIPADAADWRKYVEEWRLSNPDLATQFDRLQQPIANLNDTSMGVLSDVIKTGLDRGYTDLQIAEGVADEGYIGIQGAFGRFEDWRSEMIGRTEAREAFNAGALRSYAEGAIDQIEAMDGDFDEECRLRNGERFDFDPDTGEIKADASELEEHPNGSLTWSPIGNPRADFFRQVAAQDAAAAAEAEGAAEEAVGRYVASNIDGGRPVSAALQAGSGGSSYRPVAPTKAFQKLLANVTQKIDSVHGDGKLPDLKVFNTTRGMRTSYGQFRSDVSGKPYDIKIRSASDKKSVSYLTHEIGHFLDNSGLTTDGSYWATKDVTQGPIAQVFKAIFNSDAYKGDKSMLDELLKESREHPYGQGLPRDATGRILWNPMHNYLGFLQYATSDKELWARAYAQYIAEMTQDPTMLDTIAGDATAAGPYHGMPGAEKIAYQWSTEDFAPIKDAITQMFIDLGYMSPEEA